MPKLNKISRCFPGPCVYAAVPKHPKHGRKFTKRLVNAQALLEVLISMQKNPDLNTEGIQYAAALLTSCAQRNAKSLADEAHVKNILGVLKVTAMLELTFLF